MRKNLLFSTALLLSAGTALSQTNGQAELIPAGNPHMLLVQSKITSTAVTKPNGFTYTPPAGVARGLFVSFMGENNGAGTDYPASITYGGIPMTLVANTVAQQATSTTNKWLSNYVYFMNDSTMGTRSSDQFNVNYFSDTAAINASYVFTVFTADEVKQTFPIQMCGAFQTGNNNNSNNFLICSTTQVFKEGDLYLNFSNAANTDVGPLTSNVGTESLVNQQTKTLYTGIFHKNITTDITFAPFTSTAGPNAGRFIMISARLKLGGPQAGGGTTLGVSLKDFNGRSQYGSNILSWQTASESNLEAYVVERSTDGSNFTPVGTVAPHGGNTTFTRDYSFTDRAPAAKSYYRLHIRDNDGTASYSPIITLTNSDITGGNVSIYPNPGNGSFTISGIQSADTRIQVLNAYGQTVDFTRGTSATGADIRIMNPQPGLYYVNYEEAGSMRTSKVFVK